MRLFASIAALAILAGLSQADRPPRQFTVTYPDASNSQLAVHTSTRITLEHHGEYHAFVRNTTIGIVYPNGTHTLTATGWDDPSLSGECSAPVYGLGTNFMIDQTGNYTAVFNIAYGTSPDGSSISKDSCGKTPYAYEHFTFNVTIGPVIDRGQGNWGYAVGTLTLTTPAQPTGTVVKMSGAVINMKWSYTAWVIAACVMIVAY